jgi:molybdopterin-containing oxidoreductase family iron-sulfur binding subunit
MCQHCENAPCEPVCPVYATYHNDEGMNVQIYNRCVGTRYCANNCPYQVRFFNYWEPVWPERLRNQLNPDVTVRSRGIMEKCSFCVQRIRRAEITIERRERATLDHAAMKKRNFLPACVSACPTNALNFGDQLDATGPVKEIFDDVNDHPMHEAHDRKTRGYRLLEEIGTKPNLLYLKKVDQFPLKKNEAHVS